MKKINHVQLHDQATLNRVKQLLWLSLLVLALWTRPAVAQVGYETFAADITINQDASINVVETVVVRFDEERHGIFRVIPYRYELGDGKVGSMPIIVASVMQDGNIAQYSVSSDDRDVTVKIGDPDATITGVHTYIITYTAEAAVNFFSDHDELYWNVTGNDWPETFEQVTATVNLPSTFDSTTVQTACYTGAVGSKTQDCQGSSDAAIARFTSQDFLTVVVGWPVGAVTKPANYEQLRTDIGQTWVERFLANAIVLWTINLIVPLLVIGWLIRRWMTHGRDPKGKGTVVAHYDPPVGLTPGELGVLIDERANNRDVIATIVDLAVRGYLTITEVTTKKFIGTSKDYRLDRHPAKDEKKLKPHEQKLLVGIFGSNQTATMSELKGTFHDDLKDIQSSLYDQVRDQGYFASNPNAVRALYLGVGITLMVLSVFIIPFGLFGPLLIGMAVTFAGPFMPKRTDLGADALWQAKGFKLFLEKAEKYRIQWQEREHIFEKFLPYAMALGVAHKWSKAFEGIQQPPPSWYHGSTTFNTIVLWSALNNFSTASMHSFSPPAASGSSGFGGGGFSGGGGGGGGGGSW